MRKVTRYFLVVAALAVLAFLVRPAAAAPETVLRFAGQFPAEHTSTKLMQQLADEVKEKTGGRIEIRLHPDNELGDYTLIYEELIRGSVDMAAITVPSQFDPRLELGNINGFVRTFDEARTIFAPDGWMFRKMDEFNSALGVKLLGFQFEGFIGIGSTKPVNEPLNPEVKKGILLRIPNMEVFKLGAEAMGYRTITIPWDEVHGSLQNGFAEGVNGMTPAAAHAILKDVIKYWYDLRYSVENLNYMMSLKTWEKLSEEDRGIIQNACAKISAVSVYLAEKDQEKALQGMREAGIEVHAYTAEELAPLFVKVSATWDKLAERFSQELIDEFKKEYALR